MNELFTIPNLQANLVEKKAVWDQTFEIPDFETTAQFKNWAAEPDTDYCAFSVFEGLDSSQRVSGNNSPHFIHGVVLDYDAKFSDDEVGEFVSRSLESAYPMSYVSRSYSGGIHAVWFFEKPVMFHGKKIAKRFLDRVVKELGASKLARGFDKGSTDPHRYFLAGHDWKKVSPKAIPMRTLHFWQYETSTGADFSTEGTEIDLDVLKAEIEVQYPGVWPGAFRDGSRGPRFWDPTATNTTAAVVRDTGMQCFTGPEPFVSWSEILGPQFVAQFEMGRIGAAIERYWFDGKQYFVRMDNGTFLAATKEEATLDLRARCALDNRRGRHENLSEVERALFQIHNEKRVEAAVPFVFIKEHIVPLGNKRYFNTSTIIPLAPADGAAEWGEKFPTISNWAEIMFGEEQLKYELAWLGWAYRNARAGHPASGHAQFLVGPPNCGKTLWNTQILGNLFGGHIKASEYLCSKTEFNDYLFEFGLLTVDDEAPTANPQARVAFTSKIKEFVANDEFSVNGKFKKPGRVRWRGRVSVTLNQDATSLQLLPDLEMSVRDKLMIFQCRKFKGFFPGFTNALQKELPHFASYLNSIEVPEDMVENRFGVKAYLNKDIEALWMADASHAHIVEFLQIFREKWLDKNELEEWEGTGSELLVLLDRMEGVRVLIKDVTPKKLGWGLRNMHDKGVSWIRRSPAKGTNKWIIKSD
jgi:hypothetical protein